MTKLPINLNDLLRQRTARVSASSTRLGGIRTRSFVPYAPLPTTLKN